jgi:hypothetical protein
MANQRLNQFMYSKHAMPVIVDFSFTVAPSVAAGISGLSGSQLVSAVYMHSTTTSTDPIYNPAAGYIHVKLTDNYRTFLGFDWAAEPPVTGSAINISDSSVLTQGVPYQIVTVGTSTQANWVAVGMPNGVTAAAGVSFIASVTGGGTGTGTVKALGIAGITSMEVVGNPGLTTINPTGSTSYTGAWFIFQCLAATNSSTTTQIPTAPTTGSVINMKLLLNNSSAF